MKQTAPQWLAALTQRFKRPLMAMLVLRGLQFVSQVLCFWFFSQMVAQLVVENSAVAPFLYQSFFSSAGAWLLLKWLTEHQQIALGVKVQQQLQNDIQLKLTSYQKALSRQYSSYYWQHLWLTHIPAAAQFVSHYQLQKWLSALIPIFVIGAVFPVNYFIAIVLLFTLPLVPIFMILVGHGAAKLQQQHFVALERLGGLFVDRVKAVSLLTTFNRHDQEQQRLSEASDVVNQRTLKVVSVAFLSTSVLDFFSTVSMALIAVFIGFSLLGEIAIGPELTLATGLYLLLISPLLYSELKTLGRLYHQKAQAESAALAIMPITDLSNIQQNDAKAADIQWLNFEIPQPFLHAKSLSIQQGQHVLLSGASGAGKTILLETLMANREGSHRLPGRCVMLNQQAVITPFSVRENLCLDQAYDDQRLIEVIKAVELDDWLSNLPQGLSTRMGEHPPLSGGEAHRLSLARVLLRDADFVLLDEPTAHLTDIQHQQLSQTIYRVFKDKTIIWASHKALPTEWFEQNWHIQNGQIETIKRCPKVKALSSKAISEAAHD